jgi:hypothetical protein
VVYLLTFRDKLSVPKINPIKPLKLGLIACPETSVQNYHSSLPNSPEERRSHTSVKFTGTALPLPYSDIRIFYVELRVICYRRHNLGL